MQGLVDRAAHEPECTEGQGGDLETKNGWMHSTVNTPRVTHNGVCGILTPLWVFGKNACLLLMAAAFVELRFTTGFLITPDMK